MKQKIRTASLLLLMVLGTGLVLMACGFKSIADSRIAGADPYGLNVESMTGTDNYQMELQESEVLAVHFEEVPCAREFKRRMEAFCIKATEKA